MSDLGYPMSDPSGLWESFQSGSGEVFQAKRIAGAHEVEVGAAPTVAAGAGAGTSPPAPTVTGNDARGVVSCGSGTSPAAGVLAAVTFAAAYVSAPVVALTPGNAATAALNDYVTAVTSAGFSVAVQGAPAASQATGTYVFDFVVVG